MHAEFIGITLYGFCNGFFGRDSYGEKVIMAVGDDWVVVRNYDDGKPEFAYIGSIQELREVIANHSKVPDDNWYYQSPDESW